MTGPHTPRPAQPAPALPRSPAAAPVDADAAHRTRSRLLAEVSRAPWRAGFFTTLRRIEAADPKAPPLGRARRPEDEPVRLGQEPDLAFAASTISGIQPGGGKRPPRIQSRFLGLFGPNGPLPLHLTEYARQRIRNHGDRTFSAFADLFHHRVLALFYRAWADARPAPNADLGEADAFAQRVACLAGIGLPGLKDRDALPDTVRLQFAGRFSALAPTPDALEQLIRDQFGVRARVEEFSGHWQALEPGDTCRLGSGDPRTAALGSAAILGDRVWMVADRFKVVLGPMGLERYRALRPERECGRRMAALIQGLVGRELDCSFEWVVRREDIPPMRLDGSHGLGVDAWLTTRPPHHDALVTGAGSVDPPMLHPPPAAERAAG